MATSASGVLSRATPACSAGHRSLPAMKPLSMKTMHSLNHQMTPAACSVLSSVRGVSGQALTARSPCSSGSRGRLSRSSTIVRAAQDNISIQERVVATVPFLVPMLHGLDYGAAICCTPRPAAVKTASHKHPTFR